MRVITTSPNPFKGPYARFLETYRGPPLTIYTEAVDKPDRGIGRDILPLSSVPGLGNFLSFIGSIPACSGDWRFDVSRFCRKSFVWCHEAKKGGKLFWFDSDVEFSAPVEESLLDDLLGDFDMCYLGRQNYHPCTSFAGWNMDNPGAQYFMKGLENAYCSTMFLRLEEWHDAYIVGALLDSAPLNFRKKNLTPAGKPMQNVFDLVFTFAHHRKGPGKLRDLHSVPDAKSA